MWPTRLLTSLLMAPLALAGCELFSGPTTPSPTWSVVPLDAEVKDAYSAFGFDLFRRLHEENPGANIFFSPTSAALALSLTYHGAAGETATEIAEALGVDHLSPDAIRETNRTWIAALEETGDPKAQLAIGNSIWFNPSYTIAPAFDELVRTYYRATISPLTTPAAINDWVDQATRGAIDEIIEDFDPGIVAYLINALYFKADWTARFDERDTHDGPFHRLDGSTVTVPLMRQTGDFDVRWREDVLLRLPYGSGRFSMLLILPGQGRTLSTVVSELNPANLSRWLGELQEAAGEIVIPRFELEWEETLTGPLKDLGMITAFDPGRADLSAMFGAPGPWVDRVFQKTKLKVDEKGTTAAAVTVVVVVESSGGPPPIVFDRPFVLAIYDHATETVLFVGQVTDPSGT